MRGSLYGLLAVVVVAVLLGIFVNGWRLGDQAACHRVRQALTISQRFEAAAFLDGRACPKGEK